MTKYPFDSDTVQMKNLIILLLAKASRALQNIFFKMESRTDTSVLQAPYAYRRFVYNYENLGPSLNNSLTDSVDILSVFTQKLVLEFFYHFMKAECSQEIQWVNYSFNQVADVRDALRSIIQTDQEIIIEYLEDSGMFRKFSQPVLMIEDMLNNDVELIRDRVYIYIDGTVIEKEKVVELWACVSGLYINYAFKHLLESKPELTVLLNALYGSLELIKK